MNNEEIGGRFKENPKQKSLYQQRDKHPVIHRSVRMETSPYRIFHIGDYIVGESYSCTNNKYLRHGKNLFSC